MSGPPTSTGEQAPTGRRGAPRVPRGAPSVGGCGGPCRGPPRRSVTELLDGLAGILALSTYLPRAGTLAAEAHTANRDVPIFMAHGTDDPLITLARAQRSRDLLRESGYRVEWHEYPMAHQVCDEELRDLSAWLRRVLDGGPVSV